MGVLTILRTPRGGVPVKLSVSCRNTVLFVTIPLLPVAALTLLPALLGDFGPAYNWYAARTTDPELGCPAR